MLRLAVLCPRCHTDQVMQGGQPTVHSCNTTVARVRRPEARWPAVAHGALGDGGGASGGRAVSGTSSRKTWCPPRVKLWAMP